MKISEMEFIMRGFKQDEFDLTIRSFIKDNKMENPIIAYSELAGSVTAIIADAVIAKLTPAQFRELNGIK
jgi:hypothetical protein